MLWDKTPSFIVIEYSSIFFEAENSFHNVSEKIGWLDHPSFT